MVKEAAERIWLYGHYDIIKVEKKRVKINNRILNTRFWVAANEFRCIKIPMAEIIERNLLVKKFSEKDKKNLEDMRARLVVELI